jgi:hypothetical protein
VLFKREAKSVSVLVWADKTEDNSISVKNNFFILWHVRFGAAKVAHSLLQTDEKNHQF